MHMHYRMHMHQVHLGLPVYGGRGDLTYLVLTYLLTYLQVHLGLPVYGGRGDRALVPVASGRMLWQLDK